MVVDEGTYRLSIRRLMPDVRLLSGAALVGRQEAWAVQACAVRACSREDRLIVEG